MAPNRSNLQDPRFLALFLSTLPAAGPFSAPGFHSMSSSADALLLQEANSSTVYEGLDFLARDRRFNPSRLIRVDPDPCLARAKKTGGNSSLASKAHSSSSSSIGLSKASSSSTSDSVSVSTASSVSRVGAVPFVSEATSSGPVSSAKTGFSSAFPGLAT